eukprot:jgi/Chlat1/3310/Chrsp22S03469
MSLLLGTASSSASALLHSGGGGGGGRGVRVAGRVRPARAVVVAVPARRQSSRASFALCALKEGELKKGEQATAGAEKQEVDDVEAVTRKWGLEAGLWKALRSGEGGDKSMTSAKDLLARYGSAYLATSITLSAVSFGLCYTLVRAGVDVGSLLERVPGVGAINQQGEQLGAIAIAYAAHKAASPIRFPPTVALTPLVARWFANFRGNNDNSNEDNNNNNNQ